MGWSWGVLLEFGVGWEFILVEFVLECFFVICFVFVIFGWVIWLLNSTISAWSICCICWLLSQPYLICLAKLLFFPNLARQPLQTNPTPSCTIRIWRSRWCLYPNSIIHFKHLNFFSWVCEIIWRFKCEPLLNFLLQFS